MASASPAVGGSRASAFTPRTPSEPIKALPIPALYTSTSAASVSSTALVTPSAAAASTAANGSGPKRPPSPASAQLRGLLTPTAVFRTPAPTTSRAAPRGRFSFDAAAGSTGGSGVAASNPQQPIRVFVRFRPNPPPALSSASAASAAAAVTHGNGSASAAAAQPRIAVSSDARSLVIRDFQSAADSHLWLDYRFGFDRVFWPDTASPATATTTATAVAAAAAAGSVGAASQRAVFETVVSPLLSAVRSGSCARATVLAFGQSHTGKTYTLEGRVRARPINSPHALRVWAADALVASHVCATRTELTAELHKLTLALVHCSTLQHLSEALATAAAAASAASASGTTSGASLGAGLRLSEQLSHRTIVALRQAIVQHARAHPPGGGASDDDPRTSETMGLIERSLHALLDADADADAKHPAAHPPTAQPSVTVSCFELSGARACDWLLALRPATTTGGAAAVTASLELQQLDASRLAVAGLTQYRVQSAADIRTVVDALHAHRRTGEAAAASPASRGHVICDIAVTPEPATAGPPPVPGTLRFVDLATRSEIVAAKSATAAGGGGGSGRDARTEAREISTGLAALSKVIRELAAVSAVASGGVAAPTPRRAGESAIGTPRAATTPRTTTLSSAIKRRSGRFRPALATAASDAAAAGAGAAKQSLLSPRRMRRRSTERASPSLVSIAPIASRDLFTTPGASSVAAADIRLPASATSAAASSSSAAPGAAKAPHVSYRDSVLTRVLQSSFESGAGQPPPQTAMVLTCSIDPAHIKRTLNTLRFGASATVIVPSPARDPLTAAAGASAPAVPTAPFAPAALSPPPNSIVPPASEAHDWPSLNPAPNDLGVAAANAALRRKFKDLRRTHQRQPSGGGATKTPPVRPAQPIAPATTQAQLPPPPPALSLATGKPLVPAPAAEPASTPSAALSPSDRLARAVHSLEHFTSTLRAVQRQHASQSAKLLTQSAAVSGQVDSLRALIHAELNRAPAPSALV